MNVFNRIVMVLGILLALALVIFLMVAPWYATQIVRDNVGYFDEALYDQQFLFIYLVALGVIAFVLLIILWAEIRRGRRKTVKIKTKGGGRAELGVESVEQSLEYRIDELAGVRQVQPSVRSKGGSVEITIDLDTSPSVNVPVLTDQIIDLCHDIVEGQLGVKISGKVKVNVKHEPYPRGTMPPTGPLGEDAVSAPPTASEDLDVAPAYEPKPEALPETLEAEATDAADPGEDEAISA